MIRNLILASVAIGGLTGCGLAMAETVKKHLDPGPRSPLIGKFLEAVQPPAVATELVAVDVAAVGCPQDGQVGPEDAPALPKTVRVTVPRIAGPRLAYYSATESPGTGVLGPRGWECFAVYGSNGSQLFVVPEKMGGDILGRPQRIKNGPVVIKGLSIGDTSGRFAVAHIAARLFPKARTFVEAVRDEGIDAKESYKFVPWAQDRIKYLAEFVVSFTTPAGREGAGTESVLTAGAQPISGLIMANGIADNADAASGDNSPYLSTLRVRLSPPDADLYPAIAIAQLEAWQIR
jgi:hypothetical protein